jgi:hypothetical protein
MVLEANWQIEDYLALRSNLSEYQGKSQVENGNQVSVGGDGGSDGVVGGGKQPIPKSSIEFCGLGVNGFSKPVRAGSSLDGSSKPSWSGCVAANCKRFFQNRSFLVIRT